MLRRMFGQLRHRNRRGGAVLEAAIVLPIVLWLTFGCVEFGYFLYVKNTLQGAAREGVRAGITPSAKNSDVTTAISNTMSAAGLQSSGYSVKIESPKGTTKAVDSVASGGQVYVTVEVNWGSVGVRPLGIISSGKKVSATAVMRKE
jgi:Flp pilus assembly protein TadG